MPGARLVDLLRLLAARDVDVIVVGMIAAVLQGAPVSTFDVDVVHQRSEENVARLLGVLRKINAVYRHDARRIAPTASHLMGPGHQLLSTDYGDLDLLGTIDGGKTYEDLVARSVELDLGEGLAVRALGLEALIEVKERAGRAKDIAALPALRATLDEIRRGSR